MYYISYFFIKMANGGHRKVNEAVLNGWLGKLVRLTILCALGWGIPNNHAGLNKSLCVFHLTWQNIFTNNKDLSTYNGQIFFTSKKNLSVIRRQIVKRIFPLVIIYFPFKMGHNTCNLFIILYFHFHEKARQIKKSILF